MPATDARAQPHYLYSPIIHWKLGKDIQYLVQHILVYFSPIYLALHQFFGYCTNFLGLLINILVLWLVVHEFEVKSTAWN
jgi:hypothetical protein